MLSVVLYGRNDSHGYNLHKRAAISLNAIAHLLTDPDDEILFVDYNTPDDLPTFPEAIADTLTPEAVARLRILRVRPDVHQARFAARTHLVALEPIARNVAIRRSNPNNKWVLSTNTDMIFCPRTEGASLTSVIGGLTDGFYHLPRFELPEGLWETLDRKDAPRLIDSAREWGEGFHLNEIVYSGSDNLFDGPGDFQLFRREDLFAIGGFHEAMIRGWHLDANIARRMRMLHGKVSSALDHLVGYHCDHTRQASAYHKADRLENDSVRFVDQVTQSVVPEQMDSWGLADLDIESLTLCAASGERYRQALDATVQGRLTGFLETSYVTAAHGRLDYDLNHVLPYLFDLVSCIRQDSRIGYVDGRPDCFEAFAKGWRAMGGAKLLVPSSAPWLAPGDMAEAVSDDAWIERSDLFVFGVGAAHARNQADLTAEESARLWIVDQAFKRAAARDLLAQDEGRPARRAVIINGIHNFFEPQVMNSVAITLTPFSSRIRHGYFADRTISRVRAAGPQSREAMRLLGAAEPPPPAEILRLQALLDDMAKDGAAGDATRQAAGRVGAEMAACRAAGLISTGDEDADARLFSLIERPSAQIDPQACDEEAGRGASGRLIRVEDWEDPAWLALCRALFANRDHSDPRQQEPWTWERVTLIQNLLADLDPAQAATVLVTGQHPERLAFVLSHLGFAVDIADPHALAEKRLAANDWRAEFAPEGWVSPAPVGLIDDRAEAIAAGFRYDAVMIPQNGVFALGRAAAADLLEQACAVLKIGGHLGFTAQAQPLPQDDRLQEHALPYRLTERGAFSLALADLTPLQPVGPVDGRMTPRTFDRQSDGVSSPAPPDLVRGTAPHIEAPSAWALRRADKPADWDALREVLAVGEFLPVDLPVSSIFTARELRTYAPALGREARIGPIFDVLTPAEGVAYNPSALHAAVDLGQRIIGAAQLGGLEPGAYELDIDLQVRTLASPGPVLHLAFIGSDGFIAETTVEAEAPGMVRFAAPFEVTVENARAVALVLKAQGGADFDVVDLVLR